MARKDKPGGTPPHRRRPHPKAQSPSTPPRRPGQKTKAASASSLFTPGANTPHPRQAQRATIVGVGASAGGLEAFSQLLESMPADTNLAIIFVQHLSPDHESHLPSLLGHRSQLPVVEATDGVPALPGHVYVIPPNMNMEITDGRLRLGTRPSTPPPFMPIDHFFHSLAHDAAQRAIGVILSGTASDGATGLLDIKAAGGLTFVQDPQTARYAGMPQAAIATGKVDRVLSLPEIAAQLVHIARNPLLARAFQSPRPAPSPAQPTEPGLRRIFTLLRNSSGVDFTDYKQPTIKRRIQRRMLLHKVSTLEDYLRLIEANPSELSALYQDLLIHVTSFFRAPESFLMLTDQVFPRLLESRQGDAPIRIWVPGCSTGEEVYSVAIALLEFLGDAANAIPIQIFGTDISEQAIEQARLGSYPESIAADVSADRLRRFFTRTDGRFRIGKSVRDLCIFAHQDLTRDPPFSRLDLVVCRNVLIYLGAVLQKRLMGIFHYALKPTGFLMLGGAETVGPHVDLFKIVDKRGRIYAKKPLALLTTGLEFPPLDHAPGRELDAPRKHIESSASGGIQVEANRILLSRYSPPAVIVDHDFQIVQFRGQTGPYLEPAPGDASLHVLKMAREGLLYGLRTALNEARKSDHPARREGLQIKQGNDSRVVNVQVIPISRAGEGRHFLILFEDASPRSPAPPAPPPSSDTSTKKSKGYQRVARLQQELAASRDYLQSIIQDLEAANEELQSANEEVLSSNEELQSTNEELDTAREELQSTNEELNTVNDELHGRNEELGRLNSDLINLLASVQIAIVMVTSDLRIRRFTPMAERVLNLIQSDLGRPISDIKPNINYPDLEKLIVEVIDTMTVQERTVQDRQGNWYALRVRPYKSIDNKIDGAVLALFDITHGKRQDLTDRPGSAAHPG